MVRDEVREAIIACLQQNSQPITKLSDALNVAGEPPILDETKLSKFELMDLAILKKYAKE